MSSSQEEGSMIVIDPGSGMCKAGFAGDDAPRSFFSSIVGNQANPKGASDAYVPDFYVGDKAQAKRDLLTLHYPIEHGIVADWDGVEKLFEFIFQYLRIDPAENCVLMAEPPLNPMANREKMTEVMFESFNLGGFFMNSSNNLGMLSFGRSAGMIVDIGHGVTSVGPCCEVISFPHAFQRQDFAGHDLTYVLQKLLYRKGLCFSTSSELEYVREIKEEVCYTAMDAEGNMPYPPSCSSNSFTLPDGKVIKLNDERFLCAEALFNPVLHTGQNLKGLHGLVYDCFMELDMDVRNNFYCNILLTGGTSCMLGLPERLEMEMQKLLPSSTRSSRRIIKVVSAPERKYSVWIGGSILGSLSLFSDKPMTKKDYEEFGPSIVHKTFR